jgi:hypothetical protein
VNQNGFTNIVLILVVIALVGICASFIFVKQSATVNQQMPSFQNYPATSTQQSSPSQPAGIKVPPDPGEAGKRTLGGIDSDGDGVRDDLQRYIALTYPQSEKTRAALPQYSIATQKLLLNATDSAAILSNTTAVFRAIDCIYIIRPQDAYNISGQFQSVILNTALRGKTWVSSEKSISGEVFKSDNQKSACSFDVDKLAN